MLASALTKTQREINAGRRLAAGTTGTVDPGEMAQAICSLANRQLYHEVPVVVRI